MLTDNQISDVITEHFVNFIEDEYEPRVPAYYTPEIEKVLAYGEYFSALTDYDLEDVFWVANGEKLLNRAQCKYIRAVVNDGINEFLKQNSKNIFALPEIARIINGSFH